MTDVKTILKETAEALESAERTLTEKLLKTLKGLKA